MAETATVGRFPSPVPEKRSAETQEPLSVDKLIFFLHIVTSAHRLAKENELLEKIVAAIGCQLITGYEVDKETQIRTGYDMHSNKVVLDSGQYVHPLRQEYGERYLVTNGEVSKYLNRELLPFIEQPQAEQDNAQIRWIEYLSR